MHSGLIVARRVIALRPPQGEGISPERAVELAERAYPGAALAATRSVGCDAGGLALVVVEATAPVQFATTEQACGAARIAAARLVPSLPASSWTVEGPAGETLDCGSTFIPIVEEDL